MQLFKRVFLLSGLNCLSSILQQFVNWLICVSALINGSPQHCLVRSVWVVIKGRGSAEARSRDGPRSGLMLGGNSERADTVCAVLGTKYVTVRSLSDPFENRLLSCDLFNNYRIYSNLMYEYWYFLMHNQTAELE